MNNVVHVKESEGVFSDNNGNLNVSTILDTARKFATEIYSYIDLKQSNRNSEPIDPYSTYLSNRSYLFL